MRPDEAIVYLLSDLPQTCPRCGSGTQFDVVPNRPVRTQLHSCLKHTCGFVFIAEANTDDDFLTEGSLVPAGAA